VVELVFVLEVDPGFVHGRVVQRGLVDVAVGGEYVVASITGEEDFDGEWLVDTCGFDYDVCERRLTDSFSVKSFKCGDDELRRFVLDTTERASCAHLVAPSELVTERS